MNSSVLCALLLAACVGVACGGPEESVVEDGEEVESIRVLMASEQVLTALTDVDRFLARDLPVRAGDVIETQVLPGLEAQVRALEALSLSSEAAQTVRGEVRGLLVARQEAHDRFRRALARGLVEDFEFVQASQGTREADQAFYDYVVRLGGEDPTEEGDEDAEGEAESEGGMRGAAP